MGSVPLVLLFVCLGASFMISGGERLHENFAARTVYKANDIVPEAENVTVVDRYPKGYPGAKHQYDPVSGKYIANETVSDKVVQPEGGRYEHGYYNESGWDNPSKTATIPVVKSFKSTYTTVSKDAAGVFERYPKGYPKRPSPSYTGPSMGLAKTTNDLHRYENGYYGLARQYTKGPEQQSTFTTVTTLVPKTTTNPVDRYANGYHPGLTYGGNPNYEVTKTTTPQHTGSTGNFNTMPYPATGIPFVATGAGCRTAYWAKDVSLWPAFFTAESTIGDAFGTKASEVYGSTTMLHSLLKYNTDPFSELARTGTTALLNSYERGAYPLSHMKVMEKFTTALISKEAASAQALEFETYNVDSIAQGNACDD